MAAPVRTLSSRNVSIFQPLWISVRHKSKVYVSKPRPRILERRILEEIALPILLPHHQHPAEGCGVLKTAKLAQEENLYKKFLVKQCRKLLDEHDNGMFVVLQKLPMSGNEVLKIKLELFKKGIRQCYYENEIFQAAVPGTKWDVLQPLLVGENLYAACTEDKVKDLVKALKKYPTVMILGGIVENRMLTRAALLQHAQLPSIDHLRGQLVTILGSCAAKTSSLLSSQQQTLSNNLEQYVKQSQDSIGQ